MTITVAQREAVIGLQTALLGQGETPPGSNRTPYGAWYGINPGEWCAMGQSYTWHKTLGYSPFPASSSKGFAACVEGARWFRRQGKWAPGSAVPKRGWLVFFIWTPGDIEHHVGVVTAARGPRDIDTIEGNTHNMWERHSRRGTTIAGYGIIDFVNEVLPPAVDPTPAPQPKPFVELPFTHTIRVGETGNLVTEMQNLLKWDAAFQARPAWNPGTIDGQYGPKTLAALRAFKTDINHMNEVAHQPHFFTVVDDQYGPRTRGMLRWMGTVK